MAISAFGPQGRLKKNALRGTALGVDPSRTAERGQFQALHEEARAGNFNQSQMRQRLSGRNDAFGAETQGRLSGLASQRSGLQQEQAALFDPAKERGFAQFQGGVMDRGFQSEFQGKWAAGEGAGEGFQKGYQSRFDFLTKDFSKSDLAQMRSDPKDDPSTTAGMNKDRLSNQRITEANIAARERYQSMEDRAQAGFEGGGVFMRGGIEGTKPGNQVAKDQYDKWLGKKVKKARGGFVQSEWESAYGPEAQSAYSSRVGTGTSRIQEATGRIARTQAQNRQNLASRTELYNMFLG